MWPRLVAVLAACGLGPALVAPAAPAGGGAVATVAFTIRDPRVVESSGLAASRLHPGVFYTHNDSGDAARVFAIGPDGRVLAALAFRGVRARDWEAMSTGRDEAGRPALFVGDIGDNLGGAWPSVSVYRITEPATLGDATVPVRRYLLRYADGARDAEALLVDPASNRLYVASKETGGGGLYQAPAELRSDRVNVLRRVAAAPPGVTDGAFSPDGRTFVLRDYLSASVYTAPGRRLVTFPLPLQWQGESITYSQDGRDLLVGSEGAASEVWRVRLPEVAAPPAAATARPPQDPPRGGPAAAGPSRWPVAALLLAAAAAGAALLTGVARRRRSG